MATVLFAFLAVSTIVHSIKSIHDIPDDHHAVFADENGVFVLDDKEMILNKIANGINPRKIRPNSAIDQHQTFNRRSLLESTEAEKLLDIHNEYRSTTALGDTPSQPAGTNINSLLWDPYLAKVAQDYAETCVWQHNPNRVTQLNKYINKTQYKFDSYSLSVGENIHYTTNTTGFGNILDGITLYYEEYEYFTFNNDSDGCCQSGEQCGHYTQVVWYDTRFVGCGYAVCDGLSGAIGAGTDVVFSVCNYFPAGNVNGNSPYFSGCSCDNCPSDRVCDEEGLCGGCGSLYYDYCGDYYGNCAESWCPTNVTCTSGNSDNSYCDTCRETCGTCSEAMLAARESCSDGTASVVDGSFNGRSIQEPDEADFTEGTCPTENVITICRACFGKELNLMVILVLIYLAIVRM